MSGLISTASKSTFDHELVCFFDKSRELIERYHQYDANLENDRRAGGIRYITSLNPAAGAYMCFREQLGEMFRSRTVRCWHYTRLTDDEVADIRAHGVAPGSIESMEARIARQVRAGRLSVAEQAAILAESPLRYSEQAEVRLGMFWVTDRALHPTDGGVEPLLSHWGGEVVYFYLQNDDLIERVQGIGTPVVLELAVPVALTEHAFGFAESALSTIVEELGYPPQLPGIDAYLTRPLGPEGVIAIHTPADATFDLLGAA